MVKKTIIWSDHASSELKNTLVFYNLRNGNTKYSLKLLNQIKKATDALSKNELLGRLAEDKKTRALVMNAYLIFYLIMNSEIHILSFWDIDKIQSTESTERINLPD